MDRQDQTTDGKFEGGIFSRMVMEENEAGQDSPEPHYFNYASVYMEKQKPLEKPPAEEAFKEIPESSGRENPVTRRKRGFQEKQGLQRSRSFRRFLVFPKYLAVRKGMNMRKTEAGTGSRGRLWLSIHRRWCMSVPELSEQAEIRADCFGRYIIDSGCGISHCLSYSGFWPCDGFFMESGATD